MKLLKLISRLLDIEVETVTVETVFRTMTPEQSAAAAQQALESALESARDADARARAAWELVARMQARHIQAQIASNAG